MSLATLVALVIVVVAQNPPPAGQGGTAPRQQPPSGTIAPAPNQAAIPKDLLLQVTLDRAGFSPGIIDGNMGRNTRKALEAYTKQHGSEPAPDVEPVTKYRITEEDVAGPFTGEIPSDLVEQSKLPALGYRSIFELLAERFHCTPALLERLNPGGKFAAGEEIVVPNVEPLVIPATPAPTEQDGAGQRGRGKTDPGAAAAKAARAEMAARPDVVVTVSKSASALTVNDAAGRTVMYAPVTTGSEHDPLPIGEWKVTGVQMNPPFRYNPDLFWDADPSHTKTVLPPGPNNPVGFVWIDISKEHYGLHGTPEPASIGRTESHGCVRLTNWDALKLAGLVKPGTKVLFTR